MPATLVAAVVIGILVLGALVLLYNVLYGGL
jgi:hypothetical protein